MSAEAETTQAPNGHDEGHGHEEPAGPRKWSKAQRQLAGKIAGAFVLGTIMAGVVGPIAITVIIGLLQGYHRA